MKEHKQFDDFEKEDLEYDTKYEDTDFSLDDDDFEECEGDISKVLDPELLEYFNDAKVIGSKKTNFSKQKKKKKDKVVYESDQKVKFKGKKCTILYGPYDKDNKQFYELETENGNVISAEYSQIEEL